jgi:uncharacterized protein
MDRLIFTIIEKYYLKDSPAYRIFTSHGEAVTRLALKLARTNKSLRADLQYLEYAGMLHDIGIFMTDAPEIECYGTFPYLAHGYLGRELMEKEGLVNIAPVCERHIGVGISLIDIQTHKLPLPMREMTPQSVEEKLICYADKFYSKSAVDLFKPKTIRQVHKAISKYGTDKWNTFEKMITLFGLECVYG